LFGLKPGRQLARQGSDQWPKVIDSFARAASKQAPDASGTTGLGTIFPS